MKITLLILIGLCFSMILNKSRGPTNKCKETCKQCNDCKEKKCQNTCEDCLKCSSEACLACKGDKACEKRDCLQFTATKP